MYVNLGAAETPIRVDAFAVPDPVRPAVRVQAGPLYLSLTVAECVDLLDAMVGALADLDAVAAGTGAGR